MNEENVRKLAESATAAVTFWLQTGFVDTARMTTLQAAAANALAPFAAERGKVIHKSSKPWCMWAKGCVIDATMQGSNGSVFCGIHAPVGSTPIEADPTPEQVAERCIVANPTRNYLGGTALIDGKFDGRCSWGFHVEGTGGPHPDDIKYQRKILAAIITADRAAVTATLRAENEKLRLRVDLLESDIANLNVIVTNRNATIDSLEAKLAAADEFGRNRCKAADQEIQNLNAKLAAGGGDAELLETARAIFIENQRMCPGRWTIEDAVRDARALHAALAAKGAERGE